jgi:hypothetical protein
MHALKITWLSTLLKVDVLNPLNYCGIFNFTFV